MKKIKKILLAFAPLAAIAVATPIVLTACSSTSNTTTPGGDNGGNDNETGGDSGSATPKPSFEKDATNSESFALESSSDAQKILDKYKAAKGEMAANKVLTDELANFPKKDSTTLAQDVLKMWSNNNWFVMKNKAQDPKVKETFISNLDVSKTVVESDSKDTKATIEAEYKTAFEDSNGKLYESTQLLKAEKVVVDATTKIEIPKEVPKDGYKINGEVQSLPSTNFAVTMVDPKTNLENVLKEKNVSLDAKEVFKTYITNHNIQFSPEDTKPTVVEGTWSDSVTNLGNTKMTINSEKTQIDVFLDKFTDSDVWYGLKKTSSQQNIRDAIYTTTSNVNNLTKTFKDLINGKDTFKEATVSPSVKGKVISFVISLKKETTDNSPKQLKINVKFV